MALKISQSMNIKFRDDEIVGKSALYSHCISEPRVFIGNTNTAIAKAPIIY